MRNLCTCIFLLLAGGSAAVAGPAGKAAAPPARNARGTTIVDVVQDARKLRITFELTGMDAVGFEHAPRSDADSAAVGATMDTLQAPDAWLVPDAAAHCHRSFISVTPHLFRIGEAAEMKGARDTRADIDVEYIYDCDAPQQLHAIEFDVIGLFPRLKGVIVNATLLDGSVQRVLSTPRATIDLRR
jgi:hypothetical protein